MFTSTDLNELQARLQNVVEDDPKRGVFRPRRGMFTDKDLFELEMKLRDRADLWGGAVPAGRLHPHLRTSGRGASLAGP